jgi:hypothetical protein
MATINILSVKYTNVTNGSKRSLVISYCCNIKLYLIYFNPLNDLPEYNNLQIKLCDKIILYDDTVIYVDKYFLEFLIKFFDDKNRINVWNYLRKLNKIDLYNLIISYIENINIIIKIINVNHNKYDNKHYLKTTMKMNILTDIFGYRLTYKFITEPYINIDNTFSIYVYSILNILTPYIYIYKRNNIIEDSYTDDNKYVIESYLKEYIEDISYFENFQIEDNDVFLYLLETR